MTQTTSEHPAPGIRRRPRPEPARRVVARRRVDGSVIDAVALDPQLFGIAPNTAVLHQVITAQLAAARSGTQSTRTRSEVRGGGAKPFRQTGTGRARQGSIRAPQWTGGGVALGPKPRSYHQRTPKKMIRLALASALSDRAGEGRVALVDEWSFPVPKTKDAVSALEALGLRGKVLVVLGPDDGIPDRSFANLRDVRRVQNAELNAYDIVRSDWVVFTDATLPGETGPASVDEASVPEEQASDAAAAAGAASKPTSRTRAARTARQAKKSATKATETKTETTGPEGPDDAGAEPEGAPAEDAGTTGSRARAGGTAGTRSRARPAAKAGAASKASAADEARATTPEPADETEEADAGTQEDGDEP